MYVYQIVNTVSGRKYYGITKNVRARMASHRWAALRGGYKSPLYDAIRSYGWDAFEVQTLHENLSEEEACKCEIELIASDSNCYNLHLGGHVGFDIRTLPEERQSEWKAKLSTKRRGKKPALGMKHTEENKQLFKQVSREYWDTQDTYEWKEIGKLSFKEAHTKYGISKTHYYRLRKRDKISDLV